MDPFTPIAHEDLLKLVFSVAILLATARLLGSLAERFKQPAIIGEILAGVILGPSLLSGLFPALGELIVPQTAVQSQLLDVVSVIGVMALILMVGLETDIELIRARLRPAVAVGIGGLVFPFAFGFILGNWLPASLMGPESNRLAFNLFLAVALALSAIPVLAKVLADLRLLRHEFGQTSLAAGMIDDVMGWTLLGLVTSLAAAGRVTVGDFLLTLGAVVVFLAATVFLLGPVTKRSLDFVLDRSSSRDRILSLIVVVAFAWGAFSHALHLEPILGAFAAGVLFGRLRRLPLETVRHLESITFGIFAPIFLAAAGLRLDIGLLFGGDLLWITLALLGVAAAGKLIGAFVGARFLAGANLRHSLAYGVALNARGVLGVIVATIGLSMGILGVELYSMLVVVSLLTSVLAPIGLSRLMEPETRATVRGDPVPTYARALLPLRRRPDEVVHRKFEVSLLSELRDRPPALTLLSVVEPEERARAAGQLREVAAALPGGVEITKRALTGDPVEVIVGEAAKGYDMIVLGAPSGSREGSLFDPTLDEIVRLAPCPSLIVSHRGGQWPPRTIMVPTGGSGPASRAADLAFALAGETSQVVAFHAVEPDIAPGESVALQTSPAARLDVGHNLLNSLRSAGEGMGVAVATEIVMGTGIVDAIVARARQDVDLLVLGTNVRPASSRLYLGPKVERLLAEAPCTTIVFNV